jgi:hypothetical protein
MHMQPSAHFSNKEERTGFIALLLQKLIRLFNFHRKA